jgi:hypothetical protein
MTTTTSYHLAVLGDHLGGLAAAALAARRGKRVLLLETAAAGAARPFELLNGVAGGPDAEPGLGRFFQELGYAPFGPLGDDRIHFHALVPPLQLCLPGHRVNLHADRTARAWELQREFGEAHRALAAIWQREQELRERLEKGAPQPGAAAAPLALRALSSVSGFVRLQAQEREWSKEGFAAFLDGQGLHPDLRAALVAQAEAVLRRPVAGAVWAEGLHALRAANGGLYANAAGQSGVLVGLRAAFVATGGDVRPLVALEGIDVPRTGGARLHLAAGGTVRADRVLVDLPLAEGLRHVPDEQRRALAKKGLEECEQLPYGLLEFTLAPGKRPIGMGNCLAIAAGEGEADGPCVLMAAADDAESGACAVEALGFFPDPEGTGQERLLARVRSVLPFFDESLAAQPSYRSGSAPRYLRERLDRSHREERLGAGWRTPAFTLSPFTFLRNEDYAATGLTEGILSGAMVV